MDITFGNTFLKSLKKLHWQETFFYKTYHLFRYDIFRFIGNVWRFRRGLWSHHWWDHHGVLHFLSDGLKHIADKTEKDGIEVDSSRLKKVQKMRRVVELIENYKNDRYIEMAEKELGEMNNKPIRFEESVENPGYYLMVTDETEEEKSHNKKIFDRSREIERQEWAELWETLKGPDYSKFDEDKDWDEQFDGSGMNSWWD